LLRREKRGLGLVAVAGGLSKGLIIWNPTGNKNSIAYFLDSSEN